MNQSTALTTEAQLPIVDDIRRMEQQFAAALPEHVSATRFVRVVSTAIVKSLGSRNDLARCTRESVLSACLACASDGLVPDGREAVIVKYGDVATYMPMIAGVLKRVRQSGELSKLDAHVVYENDDFDYRLGDDESLSHKPAPLGTPRGLPRGVYALARTKDGEVYHEVMWKEEVEKVRSVSKAKNDGPWVMWWSEMARKTALRRLSKRLPVSTELHALFERDDEHYDLNRRGTAGLRRRRLHDGFDDPPEPAVALTSGVHTGDDAKASGEPTDGGEADTGDNAADADDGRLEASEAVTDGRSQNSAANQESHHGDQEEVGGLPDDFDAVGWSVTFAAYVAAETSVESLRANWKDVRRKGREYPVLFAGHPGLARELTLAVNNRADDLKGDA